MGAQMNIKNTEAYELASEIASIEGLSRTQAVLAALRAHRKRLATEKKVEEAMEICRDAASRMSPKMLAFDIDKELYDEKTGLPK